MRVLSVDVETTVWNKGNPFDPRNFMVCYSWASSDSSGAERWPNKEHLTSLLEEATVIPTFNGKFDLQWFLS